MAKNILGKYFASTFTLKGFLIQVNLKLSNDEDKERLEIILSKLSTIMLTFDFELKCQLKSYIDKRYTFEQLLYLCFMKVNQSKHEYFKHHLLKTKFNTIRYDDDQINLKRIELRNKLLSTENLSLCYFLSENPNDGYYWSKLHDIIGTAIMKHIILYSYIFRRLKNTENAYVQVCGIQFNQAYTDLVKKQLALEDKKRQEMQVNNKKCKAIPIIASTLVDDEMHVDKSDIKPMKTVFDAEIGSILNKKNHNKDELIKSQLVKLGNKRLERVKMMYDRNFSIKISNKFIYSIVISTTTPNSEIEHLSKMLCDENIFSHINLNAYEAKDELKQMNDILIILIQKFIINYRSCPFRVFLDCYCKNNKNSKQNNINKTSNKVSKKRKRDGDDSIVAIEEPIGTNNDAQAVSLNDFTDAKDVYCYVRRCLMHILEYSDKDTSDCAPLVGGKENFKKICKFIKKLINGLQYDVFTLNNLLDGIKTKKIFYLLPIKCDRVKRLVLMSIMLWFIEDFVFILIRSCFYVTETCSTNNKIIFYLKNIWKQVISDNFNNNIKQQYKVNYHLEKVNDSTVQSLCSKRETSGVHLGRLLPKTVAIETSCRQKNLPQQADQYSTNGNVSDFRIISGSKALNPCTRRIFGVNYQFISLYQCLKYLVEKEPALIGFACRSHLDIQRKYSQFINSTTYNRPANICDPIKKWNFIKIDIEKCFDSIDIDSLLFYIKNKFSNYLLNNDDANGTSGYSHKSSENLFTIMRYSIINYDVDNKHLKKKYNYLQQLHSIEQKGFFNGIQDFISILEAKYFSNTNNNLNSNGHYYKNFIFVPICIHERNISLNKLINSLQMCFSNVLIKIHNQVYTRLNGILHGSICSRLICDLYLGLLETNLFEIKSNNEIVKEEKVDNSFFFYFQNGEFIGKKMQLNVANEIILRIVDDYLIICDSIERLYKMKDLLNTKLRLNHSKTIEILWSKPINIDNNCEADEVYINEKSISSQEDDSIIEIMDNYEYQVNFLINNNNKFIIWNGLNFDVYTLDIYLNYDKYFYANLNYRINKSLVRKHATQEFNLKYLRLFNNLLNINLLINLRINRIQAIIRNLVDIFALSAIRFKLLFSNKCGVSDEIFKSIGLQIKLIFSLCYLTNYKIKFNLKEILNAYFTNAFILIKYLCLSVFSKLFKLNNEVKSGSCQQFNKLTRVLEKFLKKLDFVKCIKLFDAHFIHYQLNILIDQQLEKFKNCRLN